MEKKYGSRELRAASQHWDFLPLPVGIVSSMKVYKYVKFQINESSSEVSVWQLCWIIPVNFTVRSAHKGLQWRPPRSENLCLSVTRIWYLTCPHFKHFTAGDLKEIGHCLYSRLCYYFSKLRGDSSEGWRKILLNGIERMCTVLYVTHSNYMNLWHFYSLSAP